MNLLFLIAALASSAWANYSTGFHKDPDKLGADLRAAGFNVASIGCTAQECLIIWGPGGETKNPQSAIAAHVCYDPWEAARSSQAAVGRYAAKLKSGPLTNVERDDLLKILISLIIGDK